MSAETSDLQSVASEAPDPVKPDAYDDEGVCDFAARQRWIVEIDGEKVVYDQYAIPT